MVVLLLDGVLLADAGVVGVLGDGDRAVVLHALHAIAGAQSRAQVLEADPVAGRDGERPHQAQSQRQAAARVTDDPLPPRLVRVLPELDEQPRDRRRLPAGLRQPVLAELDPSDRRRRHAGNDDRDDADPEKTSASSREGGNLSIAAAGPGLIEPTPGAGQERNPSVIRYMAVLDRAGTPGYGFVCTTINRL